MAASEKQLAIVGGRRIIDSPLIARAAPAAWTFGPSCLVPTVQIVLQHFSVERTDFLNQTRRYARRQLS